VSFVFRPKLEADLDDIWIHIARESGNVGSGSVSRIMRKPMRVDCIDKEVREQPIAV
jgi:hypothetical protein